MHFRCVSLTPEMLSGVRAFPLTPEHTVHMSVQKTKCKPVFSEHVRQDNDGPFLHGYK